jgi:Bacterial SH3 domain
MSIDSDERSARIAFKIAIALSGCILALGLIVFAFSPRLKDANRNASAETTSAASTENRKPARTWNMALGDVVIVAQELGFSIKGAKESTADQTKVIARIDGQLQKIRELYRQETPRNPALMGSMTVQLHVSQAGQVTQANEVSSRLSDGEFKKTILTQIASWSFPELNTENTTINCALLFIREGMDITTLVQWEKSVPQGDDKGVVARQGNATRAAEPKNAQSARAVAVITEPIAGDEPVFRPSVTKPSVYQIKYATALRTEPNFSSATVARFTIGTKVSLLRDRGDWLEVRTDSGTSGFIRKEFVGPLDLARRQ